MRIDAAIGNWMIELRQASARSMSLAIGIAHSVFSEATNVLAQKIATDCRAGIALVTFPYAVRHAVVSERCSLPSKSSAALTG